MPQREKSMAGMAVLIVFLSFFTILPGQAEAQHSSARPLAKLVHLALQFSPSILNARRELDAATLERRNATAALLPSLDLEATHGLQDIDPVGKSVAVDSDFKSSGSTSRYASQLSLILSEKLYDNGASLTKRQIALRKERREEIQYKLVKDEELSKLAEAYFSWSELAESLKIEDNRREMLQRQYKQLQGQFRQGLRTRRDVLRIETQLRRGELDRLKNENDLRVAELTVANSVGVSIERLQSEGVTVSAPPIQWVPPPISPPIEVKNHARAQALALQLEESKLETDLVRREYWPQVSVNGEVGYHAQDYWKTGQPLDSGDTLGWSAMLTLKYNLFDFGIRSRDVQLAKIKMEQVSNSNRKSLLDLDSELKTVYLRLKEQRENIQLTKELLNLEQSSFASLEKEYRNGRSSYLDLITNLNSLIDARNQFIGAYFGFKKQQVLYAFHQGRVQEFILAE